MIRLRHKIKVTRKRSTVEFGEKAGPASASVWLGKLLDPPQVIITDSGKRTTQTGRVYGERGIDLKDGDIVVLPEGEFGVIGDAQLDQDHLMNGHDFGVVRFDVRKGG